ncbi:hypothetical protein KIW84_042764 [Lathyrus oleraceus]|uniref:Uncharacterized protein n=1 Tax=Pisum sativum TaxID=3888 RepID=A0A9D4XBS8_PEA|nr:hypothetical protein KIW84_042764 [Pisum sativum]
MGVEEFLDWHIDVDRFFGIMGVLENKRVKMMVIMLKINVVIWWDKLVIQKQRQRNGPIRSSRIMKQLMLERFLLEDCDKEKSAATRDSNLENKGTRSPNGVQQVEEATYQMFIQQGHTMLLQNKCEEEEERIGHAVENDEYVGVEVIEEEYNERFDNDSTYQGQDNMMMFTRDKHKIAMDSVLQFDKNLGGKNDGFLVITQSENELDGVVKEIEFFCSMVIKGMMSVLNEETTIPSEVLGNIENFKELSANELPSDLPHMQDKCKKVKVFNVEDDVMVFLKEKSDPKRSEI